MSVQITRNDVVGLAHPAIDAHTLGIMSLAGLLSDCGIRCEIADPEVCRLFDRPEMPVHMAGIRRWIVSRGITVLGVSYRLDPDDGVRIVRNLAGSLSRGRIFARDGGPVRHLLFAGLPETCRRVQKHVRDVSAVFDGGETPAGTLRRLGIAAGVLPRSVAEGLGYDDARMEFGREVIRKADYTGVRPVDRSGCPGFGTRSDTLAARVSHGTERRLPPLMRAHAGPYLPDRMAAVHLFLDWTKRLAAGGLLDVLSIGTSQLSQSNFGEEWGDRPNGGGVPINSPEEFGLVWQAARPMLVRTYAGTSRIPDLARMYEEQINIAWHALSLWWFCQMDGRGPLTLRENLRQQVETLRYAGMSGKPYEPNVSHHFGFRGADDVTSVVAAVLAARTAKRAGVRYLVLQVMLNTPVGTWGVQDLAKARAMLGLVRELEDDRFRVFLQPRAGLALFPPSPEEAKVRLAATTALMDDIEPCDETSPQIIHVVSYSEGYALADPPVIEESIRIVRKALEDYRRLRRKGEVPDMESHPEVVRRTASLVSDAKEVLAAIEARIPDPYSAEGLYKALARGYLVVPDLAACRDEFQAAVRWRTRLVEGAVKGVDRDGAVVPVTRRIQEAESFRETR